MRNMGQRWQREAIRGEPRHVLISQDPPNNTRWGGACFAMPSGTDSANLGDLVTFTVVVTAPSIEGDYAMAWQMATDCASPFGEMTPRRIITVRRPAH
jgi:hypothetical protein